MDSLASDAVIYLFYFSRQINNADADALCCQSHSHIDLDNYALNFNFDSLNRFRLTPLLASTLAYTHILLPQSLWLLNTSNFSCFNDRLYYTPQINTFTWWHIESDCIVIVAALSWMTLFYMNMSSAPPPSPPGLRRWSGCGSCPPTPNGSAVGRICPLPPWPI